MYSQYSKIPSKKWQSLYAQKRTGYTEKWTGLVQTSTVSLDIIKVVAKLQHEETELHVKIHFLIANVLKG